MNTIVTVVLGILAVIGTYFGIRWSDKARLNDSKANRDKEFKKKYKIMPELIKEMSIDFKNESKKDFFINKSKSISFQHEGKYIAYYENEHENLQSKIETLKEFNFIKDITETNVRKYLITQEFLEYIKNIHI